MNPASLASIIQPISTVRESIFGFLKRSNIRTLQVLPPVEHIGLGTRRHQVSPMARRQRDHHSLAASVGGGPTESRCQLPSDLPLAGGLGEGFTVPGKAL